MKIEEASKILGSWKTDSNIQIDEGFDKALQLGIEALELNKTMRETYAHPELLKLRSETEAIC